MLRLGGKEDKQDIIMLKSTAFAAAHRRPAHFNLLTVAISGCTGLGVTVFALCSLSASESSFAVALLLVSSTLLGASPITADAAATE